jgi:hypothetical protein
MIKESSSSCSRNFWNGESAKKANRDGAAFVETVNRVIDARASAV